MLPLADTTVIALEQAVAAPLATRQLADLGARVIKIERPGVGDFARHYDSRANGQSSHFVWANRGKESLTLNIKSVEGKKILNRLLQTADIFIQNLAPGAVERLGFDDDTLQNAFPRLIICHISGYGRDGPYRDKKAYDLLIQAETGLLSITGTPDEPAKVGIAVADIAAGMFAYSAILAALLARQKNDQGQVIEVSMLEALGEWMGFPLYYTLAGAAPTPSGAAHAAIAPYGPFTSGDGHMIMLGIQNEREWNRFCEQVLNQPEVARDPRFRGNAMRVENRPALRALINDQFRELSRQEILKRLDMAQIANAELRDLPSFMDHPQLKARRRWRQISTPTGEIPALLPPAFFGSPEPPMNPVPALGQHTDSILAELGYNQRQIERLQLEKIV